jgi:type II secretory pathway pseudopilin PulG
MVKTMSLPTYGQQAAEFKKLSDEAERLKKELVRSKYFDSDDPVLLTQWAGHYLRLSMIYWYPNAQLASYRAATQKKLVTIALAMAAYKSDKGKYPGSLSELAAEATIGTGKTAIKAYPYILTTKTMPVDFFSDKSDKPFMYKTEGNGYTLYSVGENMKDDAGKGDDIVIQKM